VTSPFPIVAADVGNTRLKIGVFRQAPCDEFPQPDAWHGSPISWTSSELDAFLPKDLAKHTCVVASVNRPAAARLVEHFERLGAHSVRVLAATDLPLVIRVNRPDLVGMDRLVGAIAVNRLRDPRRAAIVIDLGTAITVDLVGVDGGFEGGAILPGIGISARALHAFTDLLPLVPMVELSDPPEALGKDTDQAVRSGLYWGSIGGVQQVASKLGTRQSDPQLFLTGGAAPLVADLLKDARGEAAQYVPHLTLGGIALAVCSASGRGHD